MYQCVQTIEEVLVVHTPDLFVLKGRSRNGDGEGVDDIVTGEEL